MEPAVVGQTGVAESRGLRGLTPAPHSAACPCPSLCGGGGCVAPDLLQPLFLLAQQGGPAPLQATSSPPSRWPWVPHASIRLPRPFWNGFAVAVEEAEGSRVSFRDAATWMDVRARFPVARLSEAGSAVAALPVFSRVASCRGARGPRLCVSAVRRPLADVLCPARAVCAVVHADAAARRSTSVSPVALEPFCVQVAGFRRSSLYFNDLRDQTIKCFTKVHSFLPSGSGASVLEGSTALPEPNVTCAICLAEPPPGLQRTALRLQWFLRDPGFALGSWRWLFLRKRDLTFVLPSYCLLRFPGMGEEPFFL